MHGSDPVHWQDWSESILKKAQLSDKPIIVSSGYFACNWCHAMQQESYQDSTAAEHMNKDFISVKIDRELHPDLDHYLIEFTRSITGRAGWPQHVVLTPQGYPFAAFGYQPTNNYVSTLKNIAQAWQQQATHITELAKEGVIATHTIDAADPIRPAEFHTLIMRALVNQIDDLSGGLKGSNKFPETPLLMALLKTTELPENEQAWLEFTLEQMQNQHLKDHIHGGFYRYTIDPEWQIPHFEKMGFDNAQLAQVYFVAGQKFGRDDFTETGKQTLRYMEKHLFNKTLGLFASSQSALDANNVEGGDYLFTKDQLQERLSKRAFQHVSTSWLLNGAPPYELGWHPLPTQQHWREIKHALQTPIKNIPKDKKHILSWNGLALSAYATAYEVTGQTSYLTKANALAKQLIAIILQANPPRAVDDHGVQIGDAMLEDYAYIIRGLQSLNEARSTDKTAQNRVSESRINRALETLTTQVQKRFLNESGWQTNAIFLLPGQNRQAILMDDATPSASAILECATGDLAPSRNPLFADAMRQTPLNYVSYLHVLDCQQP